ncbi:hypothetical protein ACQKKX_02455 [Neorhizobium sp. NPDC001467]|uniref:hypothetical protein n=1 Tax=Neorhizobium sp. NPDC001467 TaxID=3390595 RepID=UPI003D065F74
MNPYSKAIGAAVGGALVGSAGLPVMPNDTPWYGYILLYAVSIGLPALLTYLAPKNTA